MPFSQTNVVLELAFVSVIARGHLVQAYTECFSYTIPVIECEATSLLIAMKVAG